MFPAPVSYGSGFMPGGYAAPVQSAGFMSGGYAAPVQLGASGAYAPPASGFGLPGPFVLGKDGVEDARKNALKSLETAFEDRKKVLQKQSDETKSAMQREATEYKMHMKVSTNRSPYLPYQAHQMMIGREKYIELIEKQTDDAVEHREKQVDMMHERAVNELEMLRQQRTWSIEQQSAQMGQQQAQMELAQKMRMAMMGTK